MFVNIVAAIPLLLSYCAGFIPPSWGGAVVCCGIGFKYLLWINLAFVVLWLPFNYPWCLISLLLVLLNINNIDKHIQLHSPGTFYHPGDVEIISDLILKGWINRQSEFR